MNFIEYWKEFLVFAGLISTYIAGRESKKIQNKKDTAIAEAKADISIQKAIAATEARGNPVALYDAELKKAYLEYPDGRRDYDFAKNTKL